MDDGLDGIPSFSGNESDSDNDGESDNHDADKENSSSPRYKPSSRRSVSRRTSTPVLRQSAKPNSKKEPGVPVPAFTPRTKGSAASLSSEAVTDFLKVSAELMKSNMKESEERMAWFRQRSEQGTKKESVKQLRSIIADHDLPLEIREKAQEALNKYIASIEF